MDWPTQQLQEAIAPLLPGFHFDVLEQVDSTNSELMRRARSGPMQPVLVLAGQQTAGRGRLGRPWSSDLSFSLGVPLSPVNWSGLSLAVGLGLVQSLHPDLGLKWPNDVWWKDRKLAGILIETASFGTVRYLVVGIGINVKPPAGLELSTAPAWLQELRPELDAPQALLEIAVPLVQTIKRFEMSGFGPFQADFNARDVLRQRQVTLTDGTVGMAQGVDSDGALRVLTDHGLISVSSAEVSVRPVHTPRSART